MSGVRGVSRGLECTIYLQGYRILSTSRKPYFDDNLNVDLLQTNPTKP